MFTDGGTVTDCYFLNSTLAGTTVNGAKAYNETQMKNKNNYSNWDFDNIWQISVNDYPELRYLDITTRSAGHDYEFSTITPAAGDVMPRMRIVRYKVIDKNEGIYKLYLLDEDITVASNAINPYFFWRSKDGHFSDSKDNYKEVIFTADRGTAKTGVTIAVGFGDGLGHVYRRQFTLPGRE